MSEPGRVRSSSTLVHRLSVRLALVMAATFLLQTILVVWEYAANREDLARSAVTLDLEAIVTAVHEAQPGATPVLPEELVARHRDHPDAYGFEMIGADGAVRLAANAGLFAGSVFDPHLPLDTTWSVDRTNVGTRRIVTRHLDDVTPPVTVRVAFIDDPAGVWREVLLHELADHVAGPLTPATALVLIVVLWVVRRSLAPLGRAAEVAAAVDPRKTRFRLADALGDDDPPAEVARLVDRLDALLDRIDAVGEAQATFAGAIAHELRTPLSLLALELEQVPGASAARARADVQAMARSVDQLLGIARLDALQLAPDARVDLGRLAGDLVGRLAPGAIDAGRELAFVDAGAAEVDGHAEAIWGALRNLVENALRVSPVGGTVTVTAGPGARLSVEDQGPGLPPGGADPLFARFVRGDRAAGGSAGLGLTIVAKTMEVHGGRVEAVDRPQGGARFDLIFAPTPPTEAA